MRLLILTVLLLLFQQDLEYKWGKPTSKGIDKYIERNEYQFVIDYQNHINDTLHFEPFVDSDDLSDYIDYSRGEAGFFERPDLVLIHNEASYIDYELSRLSNYQKSKYREANMFVKGVVMHELTHAYLYQIMKIQEYSGVIEYEWRQGLRMLPVDNYYTEFIEEGISEYVAADMQEIIPFEDKVVLIKNDLNNQNRNTYVVKYRYARQFVSVLIKKYGLKPAIELIVANKPPSKEELLNASLYYDRLSIYYHEYPANN